METTIRELSQNDESTPGSILYLRTGWKIEAEYLHLRKKLDQ